MAYEAGRFDLDLHPNPRTLNSLTLTARTLNILKPLAAGTCTGAVASTAGAVAAAAGGARLAKYSAMAWDFEVSRDATRFWVLRGQGWGYLEVRCPKKLGLPFFLAFLGATKKRFTRQKFLNYGSPALTHRNFTRTKRRPRPFSQGFSKQRSGPGSPVPKRFTTAAFRVVD